MDNKKLLTWVGLALVGLGILAFMYSGSGNYRSDWSLPDLRIWNKQTQAPTQYFREKCEIAKAFRIYRDHKGRWACKLEDGRVWTEDD